jgi:predicted permease
VLGRLLAALIVGPDADVLRGDLEEAFQRRMAREGNSLRVRSSHVIDVLGSVLHWWWARLTVRQPSTVPVNERGGRNMATLGHDLRQTWRGLLRRPGYTGMVALTLGLGIGATTTIYSVVDATLVRPLPYRDADRLVMIGNTTPGNEWVEGGEGLQRLEVIALPAFRDAQARVSGLRRAAAIERGTWLAMPGDAPPELLDVANVEAGFFDLLSVEPALGRVPRDGDEGRPGAPWPTAISYASWQTRFGGDPNVLGKRFGDLFVVVGVLPRDFTQPAALVGKDVEFWVLLDPNNRRYNDARSRGVKVLAQLDPGVSLVRIRRDFSMAQSRLAAEQPATYRLRDGKTLGIGVNALRDATIGTGGRPIIIFLGAALLLLLLAGVNAANLLLVRGLDRDGELSLRRALGAGRVRLATSLVMESISLAIVGGLVGLGIAVAGVAAFRQFGPQSLPRMGEVAVNARIVVAGSVLSVVLGAIVGLVPAIRSSRVDPLSNLRSSINAFSPRGTRLRTSLAATQLALAIVLGVGASLLFRSFVYLRTERLGFEPHNLVTFSVASKSARPWETWNTVIERVSALPGVSAVAAASSLPFQAPVLSFRAAPADQPSDASVAAIAGYAVTPTFFATAKTPVVRGRAFDSSDQPDSRRVAIVNEQFARAAFGKRDPIGQRLRLQDAPSGSSDLEVVGVVGDVVQARVEDGMQPAIYVPYTQAFAPLNVLAATRRDQEALGPEIRRSLAEAGLRMAPVLGVTSMQNRIAESLSTPRFQLLIIAAFAGVAVLLAAIGLYGTLAFTVRSRVREIGIRMAMGATQRQIFELVMRQSGRVLGAGLTAGLLAALGLTRLLQGFLYRVSPLDPLAFLVALLIVVVAVVIASIHPAGRAARVDPNSSMRTDV